jgi:hypothetical protein
MQREVKLTQRFIPGQKVRQIMPVGFVGMAITGIITRTDFDVKYRFNRHTFKEAPADVTVAYTVLVQSESGEMQEHQFFERELEPVAKSRLQEFSEVLIHLLSPNSW